MLSTVFAAEVQVRHDAEARAREFAILGSIRDRKAAMAASARMPITVRRALTWPRPIGVGLDLAERTAPAHAIA